MSILTNLGTKLGTEFKADRTRLASLEDTITTKVAVDSAQALASGTALSISGNTLSLSRGNGTSDTIDLSAYLDEDARAIASGVLNASTGIVTFTRDDATTFTLDLSGLLDDTNLVTSVNGQAGVVSLDTDDVQESGTPTNKYFTDARARAAISVSGSLSYNSTTGVISYTTPAETNDLTAAVTWANVPDANITQSSVTQHQAALSVTESQISDLQTYVVATDQGTYLDFESSFNAALV